MYTFPSTDLVHRAASGKAVLLTPTGQQLYLLPEVGAIHGNDTYKRIMVINWHLWFHENTHGNFPLHNMLFIV